MFHKAGMVRLSAAKRCMQQVTMSTFPLKVCKELVFEFTKSICYCYTLLSYLHDIVIEHKMNSL